MTKSFITGRDPISQLYRAVERHVKSKGGSSETEMTQTKYCRICGHADRDHGGVILPIGCELCGCLQFEPEGDDEESTVEEPNAE